MELDEDVMLRRLERQYDNLRQAISAADLKLRHLESQVQCDPAQLAKVKGQLADLRTRKAAVRSALERYI